MNETWSTCTPNTDGDRTEAFSLSLSTAESRLFLSTFLLSVSVSDFRSFVFAFPSRNIPGARRLSRVHRHTYTEFLRRCSSLRQTTRSTRRRDGNRAKYYQRVSNEHNPRSTRDSSIGRRFRDKHSDKLSGAGGGWLKRRGVERSFELFVNVDRVSTPIIASYRTLL